MKNKAIIFDIGGVIADDMHSPMLKKLAIERYPSESVEKFLEAEKIAWKKLEFDKNYSENEFWKEIIDSTGMKESVDELKDILRKDHMTIFWGPMSVADRLRKRGYLIGILSNHCDIWFNELTDRYRLFDVFSRDLTVVSYEVGCAKPDQIVYQVIYEKVKTKNNSVVPQSCIFVDDKQRNVIAARKFGLTSFQFDARVDETKMLVNNLRAFGIESFE